jgi:hypothetical protein
MHGESYYLIICFMWNLYCCVCRLVTQVRSRRVLQCLSNFVANPDNLGREICIPFAYDFHIWAHLSHCVASSLIPIPHPNTTYANDFHIWFHLSHCCRLSQAPYPLDKTYANDFHIWAHLSLSQALSGPIPP